MSDPDTKPSGGRPSKVTLATSLGGASCLVLIFSLFETLSRLRGVDMREQVSTTLSEPPFDTVPFTTADVLAGMRVMTFVAAALAAAGVVLAVYAARRHKGARIGFTVVAALLLFTTPVSGVLTFLVGIAALLLWGEPARAWFKGHDPKTAGARRQEALMSAGDRSSEGSGSSWPYGPQGSDPGAGGDGGSGHQPGSPPDSQPSGEAPQPPPYGGSFGDAAPPAVEPSSGRPGEQQPWQGQPADQQPWQGQQWQGQPQGQPPYGQAPGQGAPGGQGSYGYPTQYGQGSYGQVPGQPYGSPYGPGPGYGSYPSGQGDGSGKRPGTVTAAAVLTFLGALMGLLMGVLLMAALSLDSTTMRDELRRDPNFEQIGMDIDQVIAVVWVVAVVLVIWCLAAIALAAFVLRRQQWARWLLVASAAVSALLGLIGAIGTFGLTLLVTIASVAAIVLLFTGGANAWFSGRHGGDSSQAPSGPQWSSPPGPW